MIVKQHFGHLTNGQAVEQTSLINAQGMRVDILNLGGIIRRWLVPTLSGDPLDIVLGFDSVEAYIADQAYLGALVGRYANRIKHGKFSLNGTDYQVDVNQGGNCLHGGTNGFHHRIWNSTSVNEDLNPSIELQLTSEDGDQGFPGQLHAKVIYTLTEENSLRIEYHASCNKTSLYNPTQHSYFNLAGHQCGNIDSHHVQLFASHFTPTDANAIPSGELLAVDNTPFDLRKLTQVTRGLASTHEQIRFGNGYDHNWCLDAYERGNSEAKLAAVVLDSLSGRTMKVLTNMPGIQLYAANYLGADPIGKEGVSYQGNGALCFETQFYPDAPNQSHFPSAIINPEDQFYSITEYQLS
jgi:aldose 1-epimerase